MTYTRARRSSTDDFLDALEPRRMLTFTPGLEVTVTGGAASAGFDVAGGHKGVILTYDRNGRCRRKVKSEADPEDDLRMTPFCPLAQRRIRAAA